MKELTLLADGRLQYNRWSYDKSKKAGRYVTTDVSEHAIGFLFGEVVLADDVTVRTLFLLLQRCPELLRVFQRNYAAQLLEEALGPPPGYDIEGGISPGEVEYTCVYRMQEIDSKAKTLSGVGGADFHGVGYAATEDVVEQGNVVCAAGERINYSFSLTCVRHLLDLPLRLEPQAQISEGDTTMERYWERGQKLVCNEFTLADVLHGVLYELSWHGAGQTRTAAAAELARRVSELG